eukprot:jgi/Botrbrau1/1316/Bobra.0063s0032.1
MVDSIHDVTREAMSSTSERKPLAFSKAPPGKYIKQNGFSLKRMENLNYLVVMRGTRQQSMCENIVRTPETSNLRA